MSATILVWSACSPSPTVYPPIRQPSGQVISRAICRSTNLDALQCWFNNPSDGSSYLILKVEDIFERAVETVGPNVGAGFGVD